MRTVAILFVDPDGRYIEPLEFFWQNIDVRVWPKSRDAKKYQGPWPVVAHPPCHLWGAFASINYKRWGGEHNRPGNDDGCFEFALNSVNKWGGVLEHPAKSKAWQTYGIEKPPKKGWGKTSQGWVCEVWQSAYGHLANKATRLYYNGDRPPFELRWERPKGKYQIGFTDQRGKQKNKPTIPKKLSILTPIAFRDELLNLALHSKK